MPKGKLCKYIMLIILVVLVVCFGVLEGLVLAGCHDDVKRDDAVMIVLGAMVYPDGPSPALTERLETALDWWETHQDVEIVVSGGQGVNEPTSEAGAMADYLAAEGVPEEKLHLEDDSTNTAENLRSSMALLERLGYAPNTDVVVVSSNFHLTRIRMLCGRYGISADTLGAPVTGWPSRIYSCTREAFALVKSFLVD